MKIFILTLFSVFLVTTSALTRVKRQGSSCSGPDSVPGVCINLGDCEPFISRLQTDSNDASFAQFLRSSNQICGEPAPVICCPSSSSEPVPLTTTTLFINQLPTTAVCGSVNMPLKRIVGGQDAKLGSWPWISLLGYINNLGESSFKCGGTLITSRHVISAAHCVERNLRFVRLGEHDLSTDTETNHIDVNIEKSVPHPEYDRKDGHSDISILFLETNVQFTNRIKPICLPISQALRTKSYIGYNPFVAGWGRTTEKGDLSNILQEVQLPVLENQECKTRYEAESRLVSQKQFDGATICAGELNGGKDTCYGDSGGPLMTAELSNRVYHFYLYGVISYGFGCARNLPGVYTNIQYFVNWIQDQVATTS